jgi:5-deoxy-glucuronate isomerase
MTTHRYLPAGSTGTVDADPCITAASAGWRYPGLQVIRLGAAESRLIETGTTEMAVLPLSGGCRVEVERESFLLRGRAGVFEAVTDFAYTGIGHEVRLHSVAPAEIALCTAEATRRIDAYYVPADEVRVEVRGGGAATRQVNNFLSADVHDADRLIAVEVLTPEGGWSSYPPHKHDEFSDVEVELEEIYHFRIDGPGGTGLFRCYTADGACDDTITVRDGDTYLVPRGFHGPAAATPGHHMYYLNVMAGPQQERAWRFVNDPDYELVAARIASLDPDPRLPLTAAAGGER